MATFFELIDATPAAYLACLAAILVSSATHRVTGQAFGLICAPLIALAAPSHIMMRRTVRTSRRAWP
jgi:hypothetical protein